MKKLFKNLAIITVIIISITICSSFKDKIIHEDINLQKTKSIRFEGLYVLKTCEKSRFSILIKKTQKLYLFCVLDRKKIISKGKTTLRNEDGDMIVTLGNLAGFYENNNTITIQNYGNSMNEYINFTQCGEKYLHFEKQ